MTPSIVMNVLTESFLMSSASASDCEGVNARAPDCEARLRKYDERWVAESTRRRNFPFPADRHQTPASLVMLAPVLTRTFAGPVIVQRCGGEAERRMRRWNEGHCVGS